MNIASVEAQEVSSSPRPFGSIEKKIIRHIVKAVQSADAAEEPYCHYYLENAFPPDVYEDILDHLPEPEAYRPLNLKEWSRADGQSTRDRLFLSEEGIAGLPKETRNFWHSVASALTSESLKRVIFTKLAKDIALRFDLTMSEVPDMKAYPRAVLMRDTEGYRIKPHPDGTNRIVTMLYYLPRDASQCDLGTSVYIRQPWTKRILGEKFKEVARFPFMPNSSCAFVVNRLPNKTSWHGRELISADAGVRNLILCQYRVNDDEHSY